MHEAVGRRLEFLILVKSVEQFLLFCAFVFGLLKRFDLVGCCRSCGSGVGVLLWCLRAGVCFAYAAAAVWSFFVCLFLF